MSAGVLVVRVARPELGLRDPVSRERIPTDRPVSVADSPFWRQRIVNGDVVLAEPEAPADESAPELEVDLEVEVEEPKRRGRRRRSERR